MEKLVKISDIEKLIQDKLLKNKEYLEGVNPRSPIFLIDSERYKSKISVLEILLFELSSLPIQNEWIPVSERLPDENKNVLVLRTNPNVVTIGYYTESRGLMWSNGRGETHKVSGYHSITHWQPLPLPPTH